MVLEAEDYAPVAGIAAVGAGLGVEVVDESVGEGEEMAV